MMSNYGDCVDKNYDKVVFCNIGNTCPQNPPMLVFNNEDISSSSSTNWLLWGGVAAASFVVVILVVVLVSKGCKEGEEKGDEYSMQEDENKVKDTAYED